MNAPHPLRFTRADYHRIGELGLFAPNSQVELIFGEIIQMSPKGVAHEACLRTLLRQLFAKIPDSYVIGCQSPLAIGESSEPEPDVSVAIGCEQDYQGRHPTGHDVILAIEISDSTLRFDQTTKASLYAEAQIPNYWIFNLVEHCLETHSRPICDDDRKWHYQKHRNYLPKEHIELQLTANTDFQLKLDLKTIAL